MHKNNQIEKLKSVMARLRDPETGCPWDREQDYASILPYTIEEAYEVADAIENGTKADLKEELGDLLFQIMFYTQIASEKGDFTFDDVAQAITDKMISRHPHVFGDVHVDKADEVYAIWDAQKAKEKQGQSPLQTIAKGLPALLRAKKILKKVAKRGFEWPSKDDALTKVHEEIDEFKKAKQAIDKEEEFGDILFAMVNLGRMHGIDAEEALRKANEKFIHRFEGMEEDGLDIDNANLDEMLNAWKQQKKKDNVKKQG